MFIRQLLQAGIAQQNVGADKVGRDILHGAHYRGKAQC
jgi:hypothetical protein